MDKRHKENVYRASYKTAGDCPDVKNLGYPERRPNYDFFFDIGQAHVTFSLRRDADTLKIRGEYPVPEKQTMGGNKIDFENRMDFMKSLNIPKEYEAYCGEKSYVISKRISATGMADEAAEEKMTKGFMDTLNLFQSVFPEIEAFERPMDLCDAESIISPDGIFDQAADNELPQLETEPSCQATVPTEDRIIMTDSISQEDKEVLSADENSLPVEAGLNISPEEPVLSDTSDKAFDDRQNQPDEKFKFFSQGKITPTDIPDEAERDAMTAENNIPLAAENILSKENVMEDESNILSDEQIISSEEKPGESDRQKLNEDDLPDIPGLHFIDSTDNEQSQTDFSFPSFDPDFYESQRADFEERISKANELTKKIDGLLALADEKQKMLDAKEKEQQIRNSRLAERESEVKKNEALIKESRFFKKAIMEKESRIHILESALKQKEKDMEQQASLYALANNPLFKSLQPQKEEDNPYYERWKQCADSLSLEEEKVLSLTRKLSDTKAQYNESVLNLQNQISDMRTAYDSLRNKANAATKELKHKLDEANMQITELKKDSGGTKETALSMNVFDSVYPYYSVLGEQPGLYRIDNPDGIDIVIDTIRYAAVIQKKKVKKMRKYLSAISEWNNEDMCESYSVSGSTVTAKVFIGKTDPLDAIGKVVQRFKEFV